MWINTSFDESGFPLTKECDHREGITGRALYTGNCVCCGEFLIWNMKGKFVPYSDGTHLTPKEKEITELFKYPREVLR